MGTGKQIVVLQLDVLYHDNTHSLLGYVEHAAGLAVVSLQRHALLRGSVALDVDNVSGLVALEVRGQMVDSLLLECTRELHVC